MNAEYLRRKEGGREQYLHRIVWVAERGAIPPGMQVHHKNGNKRDNRIQNLELLDIATHAREHVGALVAASRARTAAMPQRSFLCVECGAEFKAKFDALTCSDACQLRKSRRNRPAAPKQCRVCDAQFAARGNQRTCSPACGLEWSRKYVNARKR